METTSVAQKLLQKRLKSNERNFDNIQSGNFADDFLDDCRQSNDGSGGPFMKSNRNLQQRSSY
jgi:hypothetical protein